MEIFMNRSNGEVSQVSLSKNREESRWWNFKYFWNFHPEDWGRFPIWRAYFSESSLKPDSRMMGWFNHQPGIEIVALKFYSKKSKSRFAFVGFGCPTLWSTICRNGDRPPGPRWSVNPYSPKRNKGFETNGAGYFWEGGYGFRGGGQVDQP